MQRLVILAVVVFVSGCAARPTVSENQCRAGDWQTIGLRDGASGVASTRLLAHQEACGEFGIVPERSRYLSGWEQGVSAYCTAENGFHLGQRGGALNTVCSADLREPFATAYVDGRQIYTASREVSRLSQQLADHEQRLVQLKEEMVGATTAQLIPDLSPQERIGLLAKLEALAEERAAVKAELPEIEFALQGAESHLAGLRQDLAFR